MQMCSGSLERVWGYLCKGRSTNGGERVLRVGAKDGWLCQYQFRDILELIVYPPDNLVDAIMKHHDKRFERVGWRPRARASSMMAFEGITLADAAMVLIEMEHLGIDCQPQPGVDFLRPKILKMRRITFAELHVLWYPKERHRGHDRVIYGAEPIESPEQKEVVTVTGHKAWWADDSSGLPRIIVEQPLRARVTGG